MDHHSKEIVDNSSSQDVSFSLADEERLSKILKELDQDHLLPLLVPELRRRLENGDEDLKCMRKDDAFLTLFLRVKKYNLEKAFHGIQCLQRVIKENRDLAEYVKPSQFAYIYDYNILMLLKERCRAGSSVLVVVARNWDPKVCTIFQIAQAYLLYYLQLVLGEDDANNAKETQLMGVSVIADLKDIPFSYLRFLSPRHIKLLLMLIRDSESLSRHFTLETLPLSIGGELADGVARNSQIHERVLQEDAGFERYYAGKVW